MKKCFKRGIAFAVCFMLAFSCVFVNSGAATSISGYYFGEDFASGDISNWTEQNVTGHYSVTQLDGENVLKFDYKTSTMGAKYLLIPNQSVVPQSGIEEFVFTTKFSKVPQSLYGGLEIVYDYTDNDNYKFITVGEFNKSTYIREWTVSEGKVSNTLDKGLGGLDIDFTDWFSVSVSYTNGKASIVLKQNGVTKNTSYTTATTPVMFSNYRINGNESSTMYIKSAEVYFGGYSAQLASTYQTKYKALFEKSLQEINAADKETINAAYADYERLSTYYQSEFYRYIVRLNGYSEKLTALENGSYDDTVYTNLANWEWLKGKTSASNFKVDSEGVITLSSNVMYRFAKSAFLGEDQIVEKYTYKIKYSSANNGGKGIYYVYDFTDNANYKYNTIWYDKTHGFFDQYFACENGTEKSTGTGYANSINTLEGWLDVEVDLSTTGKYKFTITNNSAVDGGSYSTTVSSSSGLNDLIIYANTACEIKDVKAYVYDEGDFTAYQKEVKLFKQNYSEYLTLTTAQVSKNATLKAGIEAAIADYENNLSDYAKQKLSKQYELLKSLLEAMDALEGEYDTTVPQYETDEQGNKYYNWEDDFENGLKKWSACGSGSNVYKPTASVITDPLDASNNVLSAAGKGYVYPSSYTLPEKAMLQQVSFRVREASGNLFYENRPFTVMLSFVDENNWQILEIYNWKNGDHNKLSYRISKCVDGSFSAGYHYGNRCNIYDYNTDYIDVLLTYSTSGTSVRVEVSYGENTDIFSSSLSVSYGQFGLWSQDGGFKWTYDDVKIKYTEGSWEEDIKIDKIYPYFTGNTEYFPDDVLTVYGENIYDNVSRVEFAPVSDSDYRAAVKASAECGNIASIDTSFLPETSYSHDKQESGVYIKAANASWDSSKAVKLKMQQPSANSFKVILPTKDALGNPVGDGIYALKLCGNDSSGANDVIIYINNPEIDYIVGDDGDHATQGGQLRVIGENMALYYDEVDENDFIKDTTAELNALNEALETDKYKVYVKVASEKYTKIFSTLTGEVTIQSRNSLIVDLPDNIPAGEYEVSVYNGYGDNSCWSAPVKAIVDVNVRSTWVDAVYDITNYGAVASNSDQNITGILMNVIQYALDRTNGGIIYIPAGRYKLIHSLTIPEHIQLVGDGSDKTILYWEPLNWQFSHCPEYLIAFERNIAVEGIGFYGTRAQLIARSYGGASTQNSTTYNENIYFSDVVIKFQPLLGVVSGGSGVGVLIDGNSQNKILAECANEGYSAFAVKNPYNLQLDNVTVTRPLTAYANTSMVLSYGDYVHMNNCYVADNWQHGNINNSIIEYTEFAKTTVGYQADNVYYHGNTIYERTVNNRELFVADGSPASNSGSPSAIITVATQEECESYGWKYGYVYRVISGWGTPYKKLQLYVRNGQGEGQTRITDGYEFKTKTVDGKTVRTAYVHITEPFTVQPNSNSRIVARDARENMYFNYMYYENGLATGYFGGFADTVYDMCHWNTVTDIYFDSYNNDLNWYLSMINGTFENAYNFHDIGSSEWKTDYGSIIFTSQNGSAAAPTSVIRFYGNDLDGYYIKINSAYAEGIHDVVIQKNNWDNSFVVMKTQGQTNGGDGIFLYKNILNDNEKYIDNKYTGSNTLGSKRVICYVTGDTDGFEVGDVNGDGSITIKDSTLIKYYISGELTLQTEQINRCDFYTDGVINTADAIAIRHYCLTGERLSAETDEDDGYYDEIL